MDLKDQQIYAAYNPGGLTAIWAEENSRQALFAALQRREVYATSGTRIKLRVHQTFAEPSATMRSSQDTASPWAALSRARGIGKTTYYPGHAR